MSLEAATPLNAKGVTMNSEELERQLLVNLEPILDAQRRLTEAPGPIGRQIDEAYKRVADVLQPVVLQVAEIQASLVPAFDQVTKAFEDLPPRQRRALELLASDGWYLDPGLQFYRLFELADLVEVGEHDRARRLLAKHFDARVEPIEADLVRRFPERANPIKAAMRAHIRGEYALSVPVFLAQADGICNQLIGGQLYARRDGKPRIAARLRLDERTPFMASLLCPLAEPMPISAGADERGLLSDLLNRHAVLHGEATDYDTHTNSCRSLSLLAYVAWVLEKLTRAKAA